MAAISLDAAADMVRRPASLKVRALQWLAQREHSPAELRVKLLRAASGQPVATASESEGLHLMDPADLDADDGEAVAVEAASGRRAGRPSPEVVAEVDALLAWLTTHKYLSSERFVESRVNARQSRYGNQRITRELQQHGLALGQDAQQALKDSELSRAREVWARKFGTVTADPGERVRQMRFLAGRGFGNDVVRRLEREG
ncbi:MAG: recombination regulator RecX [Burkholderiales bacterium PBB5]|nr:MAG: recombination regulator RecX [Burkholderiales bacterium PBB5]